MPTLTSELDNRQSPVTLWLHTKFPNAKAIQAQFRIGAGAQELSPPAGVAPGTQGAAIDWWLRMLVDADVPIDLALRGLLTRRAPCVRGGLELLAELSGQVRVDEQQRHDLRMRPATFSTRDGEWFARVCYALALLVECYRTEHVQGSRLMRLGPDARGADLLSLVREEEVADLIAMKELARDRLLPFLPPGQASTGMTFDGSEDLDADADLIVGGMVVDFKAGQGTLYKGIRRPSLRRPEIDQLLGYTLMDYSDTYAIRTVAIYAVRFGYLGSWPLSDLFEQMSGRPLELETLRREFSDVLLNY